MLPGPPSLRLRHLIFPSLRFTPFPPPSLPPPLGNSALYACVLGPLCSFRLPSESASCSVGLGEVAAVWEGSGERKSERVTPSGQGRLCLASLRGRAAFVPRSLLGVVVPGPGVPGRRERGRGSLAPIPREGPRGLLTQRVAGAARLDPERRCTWSPRRRRSQPALERGRSGVEGEATGADSGAGECGGPPGPAGSAVAPRGRPGSGAFSLPFAAAPPRPPLCFVSAGPRRL